MIISNEVELDFDDVLLLPNRSKAASRSDVIVTRRFQFYHSSRIFDGIPIMAANMSSVGTVEMAKTLSYYGALCAIHKHYTAEELYTKFPIHEKVWYTTGIREEDLAKLESFYDMLHQPNIVVDVPNGYTDKFVETCGIIRKKCPGSIIMAGNVCTGEMVQELILHGGVDIVKVGIGPGKNCSTRYMTGIGRPQLSAIMECASVAHNLKNGEKRLGLVCADGGCSTPGDVCKAFAAGADFVMLGSMFAGCDECDGEWKYDEMDFSNPKTKVSMTHYGMSSEYAQNLHYGGKKDYITPEGIVTEVPYKGSAKDVLNDILGGIRSCCTYLGTDNIKYMNRHARFVRVNRIK